MVVRRQAASTGKEEFVLAVRSMSDTRHSTTVNTPFFFFSFSAGSLLFLFATRELTQNPPQGTDATMQDFDRKDVETSPRSVETHDPYALLNGIKTEDELAVLRRGKQGKGIERYHRRQNDVGTHGSGRCLNGCALMLTAPFLPRS